MDPASPGRLAASDSFASRVEDVRRAFAQACAASQHGGPPPDVESFVSSLPEPERSSLRSELQALADESRRHHADSSRPQADTAVPLARNVATIDDRGQGESVNGGVARVSAAPESLSTRPTVEHKPATPA